jgi:hypothetical protein
MNESLQERNQEALYIGRISKRANSSSKRMEHEMKMKLNDRSLREAEAVEFVSDQGSARKPNDPRRNHQRLETQSRTRKTMPNRN